MADALGLAASIIQVVSTGVQASAYLYGFADTVSSAGKALKEISNDISLTTSVLEQLKKVLESERARDTASAEALSAAEALVRECSNVFDAIVALIKKHFPDLTTDHRKRLKLSFLKWPIIQPKVEVLRLNLEKHKTRLILMIQVLTLAKMAVSQQREIEDQIEYERQKLEALLVISSRTKTVSKAAVNTFGLTELFSPATEVSVDIVFVHGLFGHPRTTWTSDDTDVFWPADLLPPILEDDGTRILTYGYESGADSFTDKEERCKVHEIVESLGRDLASNRQIRKATQRPLVFVAHSLGGLIVKGILAHSSKSSHVETPNLRSISLSTYGVAFLATPHNILASHIHLLCETAVQRKMSEISHAMEQLKAKHAALQVLNLEFLNIAHEYQHHCFQEMLEPRILDDLCARLSMLHSGATRIRTDHYGICKFSTDSSPGFDVVCAVIQGFVSRAPGVIHTQWKGEQTKMQLQNSNLAFSKPPIVDESSLQWSRRASCKRREYRPSAHSCNPQLLGSTPIPILITENEPRPIHEQPSRLVNEAGWEHYDWSPESSFRDPSRLSRQLGTPSNYPKVVNGFVSTPTAWRGIAPPSKVDNGGVEVGKPLAFTTRRDEFLESDQAIPPPIPQSVFTPRDENSAPLGRHWPSESHRDELGDRANARRYYPLIFTPKISHEAASAFAHGAPDLNYEQELHFNNRLHPDSTFFPTLYDAGVDYPYAHPSTPPPISAPSESLQATAHGKSVTQPATGQGCYSPFAAPVPQDNGELPLHPPDALCLPPFSAGYHEPTTPSTNSAEVFQHNQQLPQILPVQSSVAPSPLSDGNPSMSIGWISRPTPSDASGKPPIGLGPASIDSLPRPRDNLTADKLHIPSPKKRKTHNPLPSTPKISTPSPTPNLQDLNATQEEQARAKEEVLNLLGQWTTVDVSKFFGSEGSARDVKDEVQAGPVICQG